MKPDLASALPIHDHAKPEAAGCGGCCGHAQPVASDVAEHAHDHDHHDHDHDHHDHGHGHAPVAAAPVDAAARAAATGRTVVRIEQMDCPTEERMIRAKLGSADGVVALDFNLLERHLTIHHTDRKSVV